jgi:uncharacterized membrane protein YjgN (DUF898 family)
MGLYSKYAELTIDEVFQAYINLDKSKNPYQAIELKNEIEHRKAHGEVPSTQHETYLQDTNAFLSKPGEAPVRAGQEMALAFNGTSAEYFRIWIVNLCLTLLTFGIFSAWAKVRRKRYFYSHTTLGGTPFQYLGQPLPILKGRLVAVTGFAVWYSASHFASSLLPYVLGIGLVAAPWVLVRSAAFNARYSAFRNMTFHLEGGYGDAAKVLYAWGILPAFAICFMFKGFGNLMILVLVSLVFSFSFPWLVCRIKKFMVEHTCFGGKRGEFSARGRQFFGIYITSGLIVVAITVPIGMIVAALIASFKNITLLAYLGVIPTYFSYILGYAFVRAESTNLVWGHTCLGPLKFKADMEVTDLVGLYITNALGIIASCGLMIPWAVIRTKRYRAEHLRVWQGGPLSQFVGSEKRTVAAIGAEALDIFDWDLSI